MSMSREPVVGGRGCSLLHMLEKLGIPLAEDGLTAPTWQLRAAP
eukprot:CAMPEP_0173435088 /NCGR_PEP_ID=MMETSP1357-20121228/14165_1 /TAXON_ID=77926 /ORGANISM="Hemiselmis rufescens, Strain PCC563" /LENGTH=43 /DNA_ID= /DNA_START= /DNA_END= /DNA_ORIENTATION=